jgi:hypothetical protein
MHVIRAEATLDAQQSAFSGAPAAAVEAQSHNGSPEPTPSGLDG